MNEQFVCTPVRNRKCLPLLYSRRPHQLEPNFVTGHWLKSTFLGGARELVNPRISSHRTVFRASAFDASQSAETEGPRVTLFFKGDHVWASPFQTTSGGDRPFVHGDTYSCLRAWQKELIALRTRQRSPERMPWNGCRIRRGTNFVTLLLLQAACSRNCPQRARPELRHIRLCSVRAFLPASLAVVLEIKFHQWNSEGAVPTAREHTDIGLG
jgi:hypothetical protein